MIGSRYNSWPFTFGCWAETAEHVTVGYCTKRMSRMPPHRRFVHDTLRELAQTFGELQKHDVRVRQGQARSSDRKRQRSSLWPRYCLYLAATLSCSQTPRFYFLVLRILYYTLEIDVQTRPIYHYSFTALEKSRQISHQLDLASRRTRRCSPSSDRTCVDRIPYIVLDCTALYSTVLYCTVLHCTTLAASPNTAYLQHATFNLRRFSPLGNA